MKYLTDSRPTITYIRGQSSEGDSIKEVAMPDVDEEETPKNDRILFGFT